MLFFFASSVCCACARMLSKQRRPIKIIPSRNFFLMCVHPFPQYATQSSLRIYHTLGAKIECFPVDYSGAPYKLARVWGKIIASKIGN